LLALRSGFDSDAFRLLSAPTPTIRPFFAV
jgi:hypothetical protein